MNCMFAINILYLINNCSVFCKIILLKISVSVSHFYETQFFSITFMYNNSKMDLNDARSFDRIWMEKIEKKKKKSNILE